MLVTEKELAIQVAQVNCIEVDDVDFAKAGKQEVLEQFTANATSAHEQHTRLQISIEYVSNAIAKCMIQSTRSEK